MPAIASEPPEGISTVVSARRVLIDGMVRRRWCPDGCDSVIVLVRELGHFGHHLQADAALRTARPA